MILLIITFSLRMKTIFLKPGRYQAILIKILPRRISILFICLNKLHTLIVVNWATIILTDFITITLTFIFIFILIILLWMK